MKPTAALLALSLMSATATATATAAASPLPPERAAALTRQLEAIMNDPAMPLPGAKYSASPDAFDTVQLVSLTGTSAFSFGNVASAIVAARTFWPLLYCAMTAPSSESCTPISVPDA